jgi:calcium-translocating P-type ATPase
MSRAQKSSKNDDAPVRPVHHLPADEVLLALRSSPQGLSEAQARERRLLWGLNALPEPQGRSFIAVSAGQFRSPLIYALLAAAAVSVVIHHLSDAAFICIALATNATVGTVQEWRAQLRMRALKRLIKGYVEVRRDGQWQHLPADSLVPGDLVRLRSGERVPADMRVLEALNLAVDESLLTGESLPVQKRPQGPVALDAALGDRITMLFAATMVRTGRATAVVTATGRSTVIGQLARALEIPAPAPPLIVRMARFTRQIAIAIAVLVAILAVLELLRGAALGEVFLLAVALVVSAIPEGLPVAMTVALTVAAHRMGMHHVLVKHLPAIEALGACTLIATDKTGTLTLNRLSIERVWLPDAGDALPDAAGARMLLQAGAYASEPQSSADEAIGDAVDAAFMAASHLAGEGSLTTALAVVPYEPEKRFAASFHRAAGAIQAYVKGAPETVARFCEDFDSQALAAAERLSAAGYRVIAVACGEVAGTAEDALAGLHFVGLVGLIDPLRPEVLRAVRAAQGAGIRIVMVTGDHPLTALAIARQLGLAQELTEVVTGPRLASLEGSAFDALVSRGRVFARTEPIQKLAIVQALRRQPQVVAVTGDGINDAAALHAADVGVAMGVGGTDVAREAADLLLTDDNFASIVAGIAEGRVAYDNLRKVILLLVSTGAAEILLMLLASAAGMPPPLSAVQLLWLNLVTNGLQDVAIAFEKAEPDVMNRPPRATREAIFNAPMIQAVAISGATMGLTCFALYFALIRTGVAHPAAQGLMLWAMVWFENAHCFNCRSETRSTLRISPAANPMLVWTVLAAQFLQVSALYVPALRTLLSLQGFTLAQGMLLSFLAILLVGVMEGYKYLRRSLRV